MPDIAAISTILSSIKTATDIAKALKDADLSLEKAEMKLRLAELISELANAKIEIASVQEALNEKDRRIRELKSAADVQGKLHWDSPYYWVVDGEKKDGPYCQQCYDKEKRLVRLQGNGEGYWECKTCKNNYTDRNYKHPEAWVAPRPDWDPYDR